MSFATAIGKASRVVSTEFKKPESTVVLVRPIIDPETGCPNFFSLKANYKIVEQMIEEGMVASACAVGYGGIAEALFKMGLGNHIGFKMRADMPPTGCSSPCTAPSCWKWSLIPPQASCWARPPGVYL